MVNLRAENHLPVALIVVLSCCVYMVLGFSDGRKLSQGSSAARKIYCNRLPNRRGPFHFHQNCNGFCQPRQDLETYYTVNVSSSTYWLGMVTVNITAKPGSGKSVTGFSVYAFDENDHVAGSFVEDDTDVIVGSCNDVIAITDETHGAFHKMANSSRKNVSVVWQPDGYNHERVKFVLWVVNNHSDIYFTESQWLTSEKHGSAPLDVVSNLKNIMSTVDMEAFERSFSYRSRKGYQLDLTNPFSPFSKSPSKNELVPANTSQNDGLQTIKPATHNSPISGITDLTATGTKLNSSVSESSNTNITNSTTNDNNVHFAVATGTPLGPITYEATTPLYGVNTSNLTPHTPETSTSDRTALLYGPITSNAPTQTYATGFPDSTTSSNAYLTTLSTDKPTTQTAGAPPTSDSSIQTPITGDNISNSLL